MSSKKIRKASRGIFCIMEDEPKVLIYKRSPDNQYFPNMWCLPGGFLDGDEDYEQALIREMKEETNSNVVSYAFFKEALFSMENEDFLTSFYICTGNKEEIREVEPNSELAYAGKNELENYDIHWFDKRFIEKFFSELNNFIKYIN